MSKEGSGLSARLKFAAGFASGVMLLTSLVFNRVVFAGEWLSARDTLRFYYPVGKFWADRVREGDFPEWYPYNALGQPLVGMVVSGALHPLRLISLILPLQSAISVETLLCYPAAAAGTFLCCRLMNLHRWAAIFAAVTYAFSGYLIGISNNLTYLIAAASFPWVLWAAERFFRARTATALLPAAVLLACLAFAGDMQAFAVTNGAVVLLALLARRELPLFRRALLAAGLIVAGAALAMPQLGPALKTLDDARGNINPLSTAQQFSLHPLRLFELALGPLFVTEELGLITPDLRLLTDPILNSTWVDSVSVGILGVVFAAASVGVASRSTFGRALIAGAAVVGLLCVGRFLPLYGWAYRFVPIWNVFRYPEKLVPYLTFLLAVGAGCALSATLENDRVRRRVVLALIAVSGALALAAVFQLNATAWSGMLVSLGGAPTVAALAGDVFLKFVAAAALVSGLCALVLFKLRTTVAGPLVVVAQSALLVWLHLSLPQTVDVPLLEERTGFIDLMHERGAGSLGGPRVHAGARSYDLPPLPNFTKRELLAVGLMISLEPDLPALHGIESSSYYMPAGSNRVILTIRDGPLFLDHLGALFGARYYSAQIKSLRDVLRVPSLRVISQLPEWDILLAENLNAQPRVYLALPRCTVDRQSALRTIPTPGFRPGIHALVECGRNEDPEVLSRLDHSPGTAALLSYQSDEVSVKVQAREAGILVLNDAYYSGWSATVDGEAAPIEPVNVAVRGVRVDAGEHVVVFTYRQRWLRGGLAAAGAMFLLLTAAIAFESTRTRARA